MILCCTTVIYTSPGALLQVDTTPSVGAQKLLYRGSVHYENEWRSEARSHTHMKILDLNITNNHAGLRFHCCQDYHYKNNQL